MIGGAKSLNRLNSGAECGRRNFLKASGVLVADAFMAGSLKALAPPTKSSGQKVLLLISGGVRLAETFSGEGVANIPNLSGALLRQGLFYAHVRNEGVTSHFNTTSSILTGNWQRVDDWGKLPPSSPTVFELLRKERSLSQTDVWIVSSNKALTKQIGASSVRGYGPAYGANVIFPKQLLINTVENALLHGKTQQLADRQKAEAEIANILRGNNYEGLGWNVFDRGSDLDSHVRDTILQAVSALVHDNAPVTGDEFTYLMAVEVMRKFAPDFLTVSFSDVEAAHFGSYSLHLAGIRNLDRLAHQLWQEVQSNPEYRDRTTMIIVPEFGRDPDGSSTNGFFNHRSNTDTCRETWMMCLGSAVRSAQVVERPVRHIDIFSSLADLFSFSCPEVSGRPLRELRA